MLKANTEGTVAFMSDGNGRLALRAGSPGALAAARGLVEALDAAGDALAEVVIGTVRLDLTCPAHAMLWAAAERVLRNSRRQPPLPSEPTDASA